MRPIIVITSYSIHYTKLYDFDSLTVYENVAFPLQEKTNLEEGEIRERVLSRLAQVGLEEAREKYPDELSGGMVRRVAFARAMVTDPEIILFDEPTTGLDPIIRNSILNLSYNFV